MARRKASRSRKLQPAELTIFCDLPTGGSIADIGALMSQINRKTFRQGYQYMVEKIEFYTDPAESSPVTISVSRLPHTWTCFNAWTKGMEMWRKQQNDRLEESGLMQTIAAHRDFKIYLDANHADGSYTELQARTADVTSNSGYYMTNAQGQAVSASVTKDWSKSEVVLPNKGAPGTTVEYHLHMLGDDSTGGATASVGLIHAYAESRNRPMQTDPNIVDVPSGGLYGEMFDVGDDTGDIVNNAQERNKHLPYLNDIDTAFEFYPGGANQGSTPTLQDILQIVPSGNRTVASSVVPGFIANCGLILFATDVACSVKITLAAGDYKGLMARPMQDVN